MSHPRKDFFKLARKQKLPPPPPGIAHEALLAKSKVHARKCVDAKAGGDVTECQLWAAQALELLAKAYLAGIHPSLVVEVDKPNLNALLEASGISTGTAVKTINAADAYARLKHAVPNFTTPVYVECKKLAERRNAELHSGDAACAAIPYDAWEGDFWNAADLILSGMDMDLREWLGADDAKAPQQALKAYRQAQTAGAKRRVKLHAQSFRDSEHGKLSGAKLAGLVKRTRAAPPDLKAFRYLYEEYWHEKCPSCGTWGWAAGDKDWEGPADDQSSAEPGYLIVERSYYPSEFHCPTCGLSLVGDVAVGAAGISDPHFVEDEEAIEYEPEYGND